MAPPEDDQVSTQQSSSPRRSRESDASSLNPMEWLMGCERNETPENQQPCPVSSPSSRHEALSGSENNACRAEAMPNGTPSVEEVLQASLDYHRSSSSRPVLAELDNSCSSLYPSPERVQSIADVGGATPANGTGNSSVVRTPSVASPTVAVIPQSASGIHDGDSNSSSQDRLQSTRSPSRGSASVANEGAARMATVPSETPSTATDKPASTHMSTVPLAETTNEVNWEAEHENVAAATSLGDAGVPSYASATLEFRTEEAVVLETSSRTIEEIIAAEEASMIAQKRAAYFGESQQRNRIPDSQATVVAVSEPQHPSELDTGAVRAELIGEDYSAPAELIGQGYQGTAATLNQSTATAVTETTTVAEAEATTEEATVIDSESLDRKPAATWNPTEEAMVLANDSSLPCLDRKPPAVQSGQNDVDAQVVSIISQEISANEIAGNEARAELIGPDFNCTCTSTRAAQNAPHDSSDCIAEHDEQAHVVEISEIVHPSEVLENEARAEFIGSDFNCTTTSSSNAGQEGSELYLESEEQGHVVGVSQQLSSSGFTHDATTEVIETDFNANAASMTEVQEATQFHASDNGSVNQDQAQIVGISDFAHPSEIPGNEVWAELVNSNDVETVPHRDQGVQMFQEVAEQAEIVSITEEVHPSEIVSRETTAEYVHDYHDNLGPSSVRNSVEIHGDYQETLVSSNIRNSVEIHGDTSPSSVDVVEEVQVMEVREEADTAAFASKNYESQNTTANCEAVTIGTNETLECHVIEDVQASGGGGGEQAEIIGISEEIHPSEFEEVDACAEFVGPDYRAVPIPAAHSEMNQRHSSERVVELVSLASISQPTRLTSPARATSAPTPTSPCFSNPFLDESDNAKISQDGLANLGQAEESWMGSPSFGGNIPPVPVPVPSGPVAMTSSGCESFSTAQLMDEFEAENYRSSSSGSDFFNNIGNSSRNGIQRSIRNLQLSCNFSRGMELLFGDTVPPHRRSRPVFEDSVSGHIVQRRRLPSSVIYNHSSKMWITTVNTNQKALDSNNTEEASSSLRAFSVLSEKQANCLAEAWAPPRMNKFADSPGCFNCETKFAVFRRACHCRNCGVCICSSCAVQWPSKMLPETFNIKNESFLNICKGCDWLCTNFRLSLLEGNQDRAVALYSTGNVNLITPFANVKGELFYPVHCAVLGGNLDLLKWLVDEHCCPIRSFRVGTGRNIDSSRSYTQLTTSKGRSLLGMALESVHIGMVRYLVVEKGVPLSLDKDVSTDTLIKNFHLVLQLLPESALCATFGKESDAVSNEESACGDAAEAPPVAATTTMTSGSQHASEGHDDVVAVHGLSNSGGATEDDITNECIICFSNEINCVATPCGHQVCCLQCSENVSRCPVCLAQCTFMRIFRA